MAIINPMAEARAQSFQSFLHGARIVAASALGGAVVVGLALGWVPALAEVDMHAVGALIGGLFGLASNARQLL